MTDIRHVKKWKIIGLACSLCIAALWDFFVSLFSDKDKESEHGWMVRQRRDAHSAATRRLAEFFSDTLSQFVFVPDMVFQESVQGL